MSGIQNIAAGIGVVATVAAGIFYVADWKNNVEKQMVDFSQRVDMAFAEKTRLQQEAAELRAALDDAAGRLATLENARSDRATGGSAPGVAEITEVLLRDHVDAIRGPKGDKGDRGDPGPVGPAGPRGEPGAGTSGGQMASVSSAIVPLDFSEVSSGVRLNGIEWSFPTCARSGLTVRCEALLKNDSSKDDNDFFIYPSASRDTTQAFADTLTNHRLAAFTSKSWDKSFDSRFYFNFPAGIVYPFSWEVISVPAEAKGFVRLDIATEAGLASFRNVPIN